MALYNVAANSLFNRCSMFNQKTKKFQDLTSFE
jgi:hypothetical protein